MPSGICIGPRAYGAILLGYTKLPNWRTRKITILLIGFEFESKLVMVETELCPYSGNFD